MVQSAAIKLSKAETSIVGPVTKFGGDPCWLETPQWPVSRELGIPMAFIGQVALADVPSLPENLRTSGQVAYIFMTEGEEVVPCWEPDSGENAVVLQPEGGPLIVATEELAKHPDGAFPECTVQLTLQEEPERFDAEKGNLGLVGSNVYSLEGENTLHDLYDADKLGGVPCFIQHVEYPAGEGSWRFVLQLHEYHQFADGTAFNPNFGSGQAHVFVSEDGREGRMLWQC